MEEILCQKFARFLMQRSEQFIIMRRKAQDVSQSVSQLVWQAYLVHSPLGIN